MHGSHLHAEAGLPGALLVLAQRVARVDHAGQPASRLFRRGQEVDASLSFRDVLNYRQ